MEYPKAKKKKKAVSDGYMLTLWRQAVKAYWFGPMRDVTQNIWKAMEADGAPLNSTMVIECHHIIKRIQFCTRYDYRNGFPLPKNLHDWVGGHSLRSTNIFLRLHPFYDYLRERQGQLKPDFLRGLGLSENEYRISIKKELTDIVKSCSM